MQTARPLPRHSFGSGAMAVGGVRMLPEELAIAISYNGSTQAVIDRKSVV